MFGIMLEQMPGYSGPPYAGWSANEEKRAAEREAAAYEILFRDAINAHRNSQARRFMSLFGVSSPTNASTTQQNKPTKPTNPTNPIVNNPRPVLRQTTLKDHFSKQTTLDRMNDDILLLNAQKDIKKALKKATKEHIKAKSKEEA